MTLAIQRTVVNSINTEVKIVLQQYRGKEKSPAIKKTEDTNNTANKRGLHHYRKQDHHRVMLHPMLMIVLIHDHFKY